MHRAGQDVRADLGAFLDDADVDILACCCRQLLQADGRGQAGRTGADDDHVIFHTFAFHRALLDSFSG
jgi:hypothetical protein